MSRPAFNRATPARRLLADIEAWCARTGTPETSIGHALFRHPGFVGLLRKRLQLSEIKEEQVRNFLERFPGGYCDELPKTHGYGVTKLPTASNRAIQIMRDGMEDEVRRLDGLRRFKLPEGVAEAAIVDGRPYSEFLTSLVWMGLECWKDDRAVHRERVR